MFHVVFMQPTPCVRALKYAEGLREYLGEKLRFTLIYARTPPSKLYGHGEEYFDEVIKVPENRVHSELKRVLRSLNADIIHSHNAPDFLTVAAIEADIKTPIIHDVHELLTLHKTGYHTFDNEKLIKKYAFEEKVAIECSDARIYVSDGVRDYVHQKYDVDKEYELVFYNYISQKVLPQRFKPMLSTREIHIVYVGTITSKVYGSHYDLREIFLEIARNRMHIHIYPVRDDEAYIKLSKENPYIHYHKRLPRTVLLKEISKYHFGWAAFYDGLNKEHLKMAFPNKIIDYVGAGLPVVTFSQHDTIARFLEKYKLGIILSDISELYKLKEAVKNGMITRIRRRAKKLRYEFTVERKIPSLLEFYARVMEKVKLYEPVIDLRRIPIKEGYKAWYLR